MPCLKSVGSTGAICKGVRAVLPLGGRFGVCRPLSAFFAQRRGLCQTGRATKKATIKVAFLWLPAWRMPSSAKAVSAAFVRALARVFLAAGPGATLEADFLTAACGAGHAGCKFWFRGAPVGFDADFFRHEELRVKNGLIRDFKPMPGATSRRGPGRARIQVMRASGRFSRRFCGLSLRVC